MRRRTEDGCKLDYIEPSMDESGKTFVTIPRSKLMHNTDKRQNSLVGYVLGDKPSTCISRHV